MDNTNTCLTCDSYGYHVVRIVNKRFVIMCAACGGTGYAPAVDVPTCDGCGGSHSMQDICPADVRLLD